MNNVVFGTQDAWVIFAAAAVFSLLVNFANRKMGIKQRTNELQSEVNSFQKAYQDAVKRNDEAEMERLKKQEPDVMKKMQEMMFLPFKSMVVVIPLFAVIIWLVESQFGKFTIELPIALHLNGNELFGLNVFHSSTYGPKGFFIVSSLVCGIIVEAVTNRLFKRK